jgi:hypothetical protein
MKVILSELRGIYTRQHLIHSLAFLSSITRMKRGSPEKKIKDVLHDKILVSKVRSPIEGSLTTVHNGTSQVQATLTNFYIEKKNFDQDNTDFMNNFLSPNMPVPLIRYTSAPNCSEKQNDNLIHFSTFLSERELVVRSWWRYAYNCVLSELRQKKVTYSKVSKVHVSFDWKKQRYKRTEYINLYLRWYIEHSALSGGKNNFVRLRHIEADLGVEQILLYRSIARKIHVRGIQYNGDSILCLYNGTSHQALMSNRLLKSMTSKGLSDYTSRIENSSAKIINRRLLDEDSVVIKKLKVMANDARLRRKSISNCRHNEVRSHESEKPFSTCCNENYFSSKKSSRMDFEPSKRVPGLSTSSFQSVQKEPHKLDENQPQDLTKSSGLFVSFEVKIGVFQFMILDYSSDHSSSELRTQGGVLGKEFSDVCDGFSEVLSRLTDDDSVSEMEDIQQDIETEYKPFLFINVPATYSSKHKILDVKVNAIDFSFSQRTDTLTASFFKFDNISILGKDECCLVTTDISQLTRSSGKDVNKSNDTEIARSSDKPALKIFVSVSDNLKKKLYIEISKIHFAVELSTINAIIKFSQLNNIYFPQRLVTQNDKDKALDYLVNQLEETSSLNFLNHVDIAFQCNGAHFSMHSDEPIKCAEKVVGSDSQALTQDTFQTLKLSASSFHLFTGVFLTDKTRFKNGANYQRSSMELTGMFVEQNFSFTPLEKVLVDAKDWQNQQQNEKLVSTCDS